MGEQIKIDVDVLERVFAILMEHLKESGHGALSLEHDYYWSVPAEQAYDVYRAPTELTIGQISECMDWLTALTRDPERALTYHLVWLGDVVRAIGQEFVE